MSNTPVLKPTATLTAPSLGKVSLSRVEIHYAINDVPTATIIPIPDITSRGSIATRVTGKDLVAFYAGIQSEKFTQSFGRAAHINVSMQAGGTGLTMSGFLTAPQTALGGADYNIVFDIVGAASIINGLRSDIYQSAGFGEYFSAGAGKRVATVKDLFKGADTVAKRLLAVLESMITFWEQGSVGGATSGLRSFRNVDLALIRRIHHNNSSPLFAFKNILRAAAQPYTEQPLNFQTLIKAAEPIRLPLDQGIAALISDVYRESTSQFFDSFMRLCTLFGLVFIPTIDNAKGVYGSVMAIDGLISGVPENRDVLVTAIQPRLGLREMIPATSVTVRGADSVGFRQTADDTASLESAGQILGVWPENALTENGAGMPVTIQAPAWIPLRGGPTAYADAAIKRALAGKFASPGELTELATQAQSNYTALLVKIMQDTAKSAYRNIALGGDTMSVTTLFDLSWELGKRYRVSSKSASGASNPLFTGALIGITHRIERIGDAQAVAQTVLNFSHVAMGSFKLPFSE